jgi:aryl-alcohol dehydrogenase-like predicted oxidoreductase
MDMVALGRTGLTVSVAALGAGGHSRLGQRQGASVASSVALVKKALDLGITIIDTATAYGTETIVGEAIKGRRNEVVISTKVSITQSEAPEDQHLVDANELIRRVHACLKRLDVDHIEIMHLHGVGLANYGHCRDVLWPALDRLRQDGVIGFAGITERFGAESGHKMVEAALADDLWPVMMIGYNFANHTAARHVLPETRKNGVGTLCMFAVRGALANLEAASALVSDLVAKGEIAAEDVDASDPLGFVLAESDATTLSEAAYRFCRHSPGIDVVLTGTGNVDHLQANVRALEKGPLPEAVTARLRHLFRDVSSASGDPINT